MALRFLPRAARRRCRNKFEMHATIGSGALAPAIYGLFSDSFGVPAAMLLIAAVVLAAVPLALLLRPALPRSTA